jgi:hypothetical protein
MVAKMRAVFPPLGALSAASLSRIEHAIQLALDLPGTA